MIEALLAGGLSLVGGWAGAYFGAYLKKKGENLATHEDIDKLVDQVRAVTQTTKEIEAKISSDVWTMQKQWEMKQEVLFDAAKRIVELDNGLLRINTLLHMDNPDGDQWLQEKHKALLGWNDTIKKLEETQILVGITCSQETNIVLGRVLLFVKELVFIAMAMAMFVLGSFSPLMSIYIRDSLSAGPKVFGAISAMVGVGLIAGTQIINRLGSRSKAHVVVGGLLALGVGVAFLGLFRNIPMAAVGTFTMGIAIAFVWVSAQTMSQQETPPAMVGRVSSSFMSLISLAQVLGLLLSGLLAQQLGIRQLFLSCAGVLALIAGAGYLMVKDQPAPATTTNTQS